MNREHTCTATRRALSDCVEAATRRYLELVCASEGFPARRVLERIGELQEAVAAVVASAGANRILWRAGTAAARLVRACADRRTAKAVGRLLVLLDELDDERACGRDAERRDVPPDGVVGAAASAA